jgi:hypothetical protein
MSVIKTDFGEGGANVTGSQGETKLATALRDIADDLAGVQSDAIAAPALAAFTDPPSAAEMALLVTLVNEIRTALNAVGGHTLLTTKG